MHLKQRHTLTMAAAGEGEGRRWAGRVAALREQSEKRKAKKGTRRLNFANGGMDRSNTMPNTIIVPIYYAGTSLQLNATERRCGETIQKVENAVFGIFFIALLLVWRVCSE